MVAFSIAQYSLLFIIIAILSSLAYCESDIVLNALCIVLVRILSRETESTTNIHKVFFCFFCCFFYDKFPLIWRSVSLLKDEAFS